MIVRGKVVGKETVALFEISKDRRGLSLRVKLSRGDFEYSTECSCLEPLEFLGLFLPLIEEELGEIKGVFLEKTVKDESKLGKLLKKLLKEEAK